MKRIKETTIPLKLRKEEAQPKSCFHKMNKQILNIWKMMSHDLRGSLVSISATLKLLNRGYYGKMDEEVENKLRELFEKVTSLIGVSEEFLGRAFSVSGDFEAEQEVLDLKEDILNPVLNEISQELKERHILMDRHFHTASNHPISLRANRTWLKSVFRNLLKNAMNHGEEGGTITLGVENRGSAYQLNVYNSGEPIPIEWRDNLFKKFAHRNGKSNNGMGLGLYLTKKIIQKHGGHIWYEAKEHGSNFVFTIPAEA